jgi:RimJ/RimL family protein N-acetyltransferase
LDEPAGENDDTPPLANIVGDRVALGPMRRDLLPLYHRWINDFGTARTLGAAPPRPTTLEAETGWYESVAGADSTTFTVYERPGWRPIGTAGLSGVDHRNRTATFGILIGEPDARGKGYGTETTRLMLDYAFTALGLHSVGLTCFEFNLAGRHAYRKAGFKEIGRRRQCRMMGGRLWDEIPMDCLASEFESPVLGRLLVPDEPRS